MQEEKRKPANEMTTEEAMNHLFEPEIVECIRELTQEEHSEDEENDESQGE